MEITTLSDEEQEAIVAPPEVQGPSKEDLIKQLEADWLVAQRDDNSSLMSELDERHTRVQAANDDASALREYEYRASTEESTPEVRVAEPVSEQL